MPSLQPFVLALALTAVAASGCTRSSPSGPELTADTTRGPLYETWNARFATSVEGRPQLQVVAGYMAQYETGDSTYVLLSGAKGKGGKPVVARVHDEQGKPIATVTAQHMRYLARLGQLEAWGSVRVVAAEGRRLESDRVVWLQRERALRAPGFARVITAKERVQGFNLNADENLENYSLARITGMVTIEE